mgnify:FL=1
MDTSQCEKLGYPKVLQFFEISSKTSYNIKSLCQYIYDITNQLLVSGGKDQTNVQQTIPAKYSQFEEFIDEYRFNKKAMILNEKEYQ